MRPADAQMIVEAFSEAAGRAPEGARVAMGCECGWESPHGLRKDVLRALRRHLIRCH